MKFLYRPIHTADLPGFVKLAKQAGVGVTSLQDNEEKLRARIALSQASFAKPVVSPGSEKYLFVLEDLDTHEVIGASGITACIGEENPFYSYRVSSVTRFCKELEIRHFYDFLSLVNDYHGSTEVGSLVLDTRYRGHHLGSFVSRGRFFYMAQHPERFANQVIAEMRGICDANGASPFWDSLGRHFFKMDFAEADRLCELTNKQFIADLMPRSVIYTELLTKAAQAVIGKPHPQTEPAYKILTKEGFQYRGYIDIFDGGPAIEAQREHIHTLAHNQVLPVVKFENVIEEPEYLIGTTHDDFRVMRSPVRITSDGCMIAAETAQHLKVQVGDSLRVCR